MIPASDIVLDTSRFDINEKLIKQTWEVSHVGRLAQVLWLNTAAKVMWPYYNQAIGQQVLEQVNPIIAEQLKPVSPLGA